MVDNHQALFHYSDSSSCHATPRQAAAAEARTGSEAGACWESGTE